MTLARALSFVTLLVLCSFLVVTESDGDLWGHLAFGRDIVARGWVHTTDPYSFASDRPWVNHEWLAEVIMWAFYRAAGSAGLLALKLAIVCAGGAFVLEAWRRTLLTPIWRDGLLFATTLGVWPQLVTVRPQMFSLALLAAELFALQRVRDGRRAWLGVLPLIFGAWVNLHGGWVVGAAALTVFVLCSWFDGALAARDRILLCVAAAASAAATLCNPYGLRMLAFLLETVRPGRADIPEWAPVTSLPPIAAALWTIPTVIAGVALWRPRRSIPAFSVVTALLLGVGAFRVARLIGLYAVAVAVLLAPYVRAAVERAELQPRCMRRAWGFALAACVALVSVPTALVGRQIPMDRGSLPEPEVAAFIQANDLHGKMLTYFDYGEYAIWHFWPAIQVSMDGRRETVYSERTIQRHLDVYDGLPQAPDYVDELQPDFVWLPRAASIIAVLEARGWRPIFDGDVSVILARQAGDFVSVPRRPVAALTYFPGP